MLHSAVQALSTTTMRSTAVRRVEYAIEIDSSMCSRSSMRFAAAMDAVLAIDLSVEVVRWFDRGIDCLVHVL